MWPFINLLFVLANQDSKAVAPHFDTYPDGCLPFNYIKDAELYQFVLANYYYRASIENYKSDQ